MDPKLCGAHWRLCLFWSHGNISKGGHARIKRLTKLVRSLCSRAETFRTSPKPTPTPHTQSFHPWTCVLLGGPSRSLRGGGCNSPACACIFPLFPVAVPFIQLARACLFFRVPETPSRTLHAHRPCSERPLLSALSLQGESERTTHALHSHAALDRTHSLRINRSCSSLCLVAASIQHPSRFDCLVRI